MSRWSMAAVVSLVLGAAMLFGASAQDDEMSQKLSQGAERYTQLCSACHGSEGQGAGPIPALAGNAYVTTQDPTPMLQTILGGRGGMPRFSYLLDDEALAAVATYVRNTWDNSAAEVTADQAAQAREALADTDESAGGGQGEE